MKNIVMVVFVLLALFTVSEVYTFSNYGFPDHAGAPIASGDWGPATAQATCSTSGCHAGKPLNDPSGSVEFTTSIPEDGWQPGRTYSITAKISKADITAFGFMTMAWGKTDSLSTGTLTANDSKAQVVSSWSGSANKYATHKASTISGSGTNQWTFQWKAPEDNSNDTVVFYSAFVAANSNGQPTGDFVFTSEYKVGKSLLPTSVKPSYDAKSILLIPNAVENSMLVKVESILNVDYTLYIKDMHGKVVLTSLESGNSLKSGIQMDLSSLPKGVYVISIEGYGKQFSEKFVKI